MAKARCHHFQNGPVPSLQRITPDNQCVMLRLRQVAGNRRDCPMNPYRSHIEGSDGRQGRGQESWPCSMHLLERASRSLFCKSKTLSGLHLSGKSSKGLSCLLVCMWDYREVLPSCHSTPCPDQASIGGADEAAVSCSFSRSSWLEHAKPFTSAGAPPSPASNTRTRQAPRPGCQASRRRRCGNQRG